jgi:divalent metal cation (Fe/Co/Zn/Cd) transporter
LAGLKTCRQGPSIRSQKIRDICFSFYYWDAFIYKWKIIINAIDRFKFPVSLNINIESLITLIVTLIINISVAAYEYKQGKILNKGILISDSLHTKSDIYASIGVLITLITLRLGAPPIIDPIISLVISCFILYAAYEFLI